MSSSLSRHAQVTDLCRWHSQRLRIEPISENRFLAFVADCAGQYRTLGCALHAGRRVLLRHPDNPQTGPVPHRQLRLSIQPTLYHAAVLAPPSSPSSGCGAATRYAPVASWDDAYYEPLACSVRIPAKANADSEGNANGIALSRSAALWLS